MSLKVVVLACVAVVALCDKVPFLIPHPPVYIPRPAYNTPAPYHAPEPSYHTPEPAYHAPEPAYHEPEYPDVPPKYNYNYAVADGYSGANFAASESRDGYKTEGGYSVDLPDGRKYSINPPKPFANFTTSAYKPNSWSVTLIDSPKATPETFSGPRTINVADT
ncbi:cuticle protein 8-like [Penaeus indicus]|uniref:cuticle protein 8-like n=1 Tax=Penaeus indicus TaxID=29960 RepID=UPI00300CE83F